MEIAENKLLTSAPEVLEALASRTVGKLPVIVARQTRLGVFQVENVQHGLHPVFPRRDWGLPL